MPFDSTTIFTLAHLLPLSLAHLPQHKHHLKLLSYITKALLTHTLASFWRKQSCITSPHCTRRLWTFPIIITWLDPGSNAEANTRTKFSGDWYWEEFVNDAENILKNVLCEPTEIPIQMEQSLYILKRCGFYVKATSYQYSAWWRHQMETFSALLALSPGPVNSPHKGQWRGALMFSLIYAWINDWVNNREADDLRPHRAYYGVTVMDCYQQDDTVVRPSHL